MSPRVGGREVGAREMMDVWAQAGGKKNIMSHGSSWLPQIDPRGPDSQKAFSKLETPLLVPASPMLSNGARNPC